MSLHKYHTNIIILMHISGPFYRSFKPQSVMLNFKHLHNRERGYFIQAMKRVDFVYVCIQNLLLNDVTYLQKAISLKVGNFHLAFVSFRDTC